MNKLVITIILLNLIISCEMNQNLLSEKEFTKKYVEYLKDTHPDKSIQIVDNLHVKPTLENDEFDQFLNNAYKEYKLEPQLVNDIFIQYGNLIVDHFDRLDMKINVNRIIPIIKDKNYLNEVNNLAKEGQNDQVYENYNEELVIIYAEDQPNSIKYITKEELQNENIDLKNFRKTALNNLINLIHDIEYKGNDGLYMLIAGGTYESSLILSPSIWTKENFKVKGEIIISIPNRDIVLICGSEEEEKIKTLKEITAEMYNENSYQISKKLFKWNSEEEIFKIDE